MNDLIKKYILQNQFMVTVLLIALGWFLLEIKAILIVIFISYIIMSALSPVVDFLHRKRVPKILAVSIAYIVTIFLIVILILPLIPFFISQVQSLILRFPKYLDRAANLIGININASQINSLISSELATIGENAIALTTGVFGGLFSILTVMVISFYLMIDHVRIKNKIASAFANKHQARITGMLTQTEEKLGAWLRGQIILSFSIGILTWIALSILGFDFALPLALIAGILEIVPTLGPIISAVPAVIVALTISPTMALITILTYIVIQALENNILVPKIMQRAVGLNPIVVIIGIMVGGRLMGILGALLSIPFISLLIIIFNNLKNFEEKQ